MEILRHAQYATARWQNGRGVTRVVALGAPDAASVGVPPWRVSLADIAEDGPFSAFPGVDRQLSIVEGRGVELQCRAPAESIDFTHRVGKGEAPFAFRGEWEVRCRLIDAAPVRALNVMVRREALSARIERRDIGSAEVIEKPAGETLLLFVTGGSVRVLGASQSAVLERFDALHCPRGRYGSYALSAAGLEAPHGLVVRFAPLA